jgi:hypothetical protein
MLIRKSVFSIYLQAFSETFLFLRRIGRDVITDVHRSSRKEPVIRDRFSLNFNFLDRFSKNPQISNFMKNLPVGDELFHADGETDRQDEDNSRFS